MSFDKDFIYGMDLTAAAVAQYGAGSTATLVGDNHIWNWKARRPDGSLASLDMQLAATRQYGSTAKAVTVGPYAGDWRVIRPQELKYKIIPIVFVTGDIVFNAAAIKQQLDIFETHIMGSQEWLRQKLDKTFDVIQPLVVYTGRPKSQFDAWNVQMAGDGADKFNYFDGLRQDVANFMGSSYNPTHHKYLAVVAGAYNNGSSASSPVAVVSSGTLTNPFKIYYPNVIETNNGSDEDNAYAILHELGHTLGLPHVENDPRYLMWTARVPYADFTPAETAALLSNPFLK